jgi:hypothetical protein
MTINPTLSFVAATPAAAPSPAPIFKALAAAGLIAPFFSFGAVITVNTTAANGGPGLCSLRDAAAAVNLPGSNQGSCAVADASPLGNEVRFAANVVGTITYTDASPLFSYSGVEFSPQSDLTITGPGASTLGISCASNAVPVGSMLVFTNTASNIAISGLGFNNCFAPGAPFGAAGLFVVDQPSMNAVNSVTLSDLVISGNTGYVGGLAVSSTGVTTLRRLSITGNTGQVAGGAGIQGIFGGADVDVQSTTIANNVSLGLYSGAAILTPGDISINNTTVSGNIGGQTALGLLTDPGSQFGIRHSTIVRNASGNATNYAALFFGYGFEGEVSKSVRSQSKALTVESGLNNSIVCGNTSDDISGQGNVIANYNLIGTVNTTSLFLGGVGNVPGCTGAQLNNWLGPLANNGGPTQTHALLNVAGNPAINGGNPAYIGSPTDQTGINGRIGGGRTDMGAYEIVSAAAATNVPVPTTGAVGLGALSLALAALGMRRRKSTKA